MQNSSKHAFAGGRRSQPETAAADTHSELEAVLAQAVQAGIPQYAEGLAKTEQEWLDHGLGDVSAVEAAAEEATVEFAAGAGTQLKLQAEALFAAGSSGGEPLKGRQKVEEAVLKWRAALWTLTDPAGVQGASTRRTAQGWPSLAVGFLASNILSCRRLFWHQVRVLQWRVPWPPLAACPLSCVQHVWPCICAAIDHNAVYAQHRCPHNTPYGQTCDACTDSLGGALPTKVCLMCTW